MMVVELGEWLVFGWGNFGLGYFDYNLVVVENFHDLDYHFPENDFPG